MPAGSFWTQPAGEVHITSARGQETIAYVEIDEGPYLSCQRIKLLIVESDPLMWMHQTLSGWMLPTRLGSLNQKIRHLPMGHLSLTSGGNLSTMN